MAASANDQQGLSVSTGRALAFGEFVLDRDLKRLLRASQPVSLKPKVYDLLCLLIDQRERVLSRAEIMDALWPRQDIEDASLTQAVYELRRALDDPTLIESLPRRGYRFTGKVEVAPLAPIDFESLPEDLAPASSARSKASLRLAVPIGFLFVISILLLFWLRPLNEPAQPEAAPRFDFSTTRLVVLPFEDFSPDGDQQFLGDGLADTLLRVFAGVEELNVIARASAFAYRGSDIPTVARELEVGSVLEGSVQRSGDQLRIGVQLVRTSDQRQVWSQTFDRHASDIFATQDEIAAQVLDALLGSEMLGVVRPQSRRTPTEVHDLYLQGRELWQHRQAASIRRSIELLQQAVTLDPAFIEARSELATALYFSPDLTRLEKMPLIETQLESVFATAPDEPQAHAIRGLLLLDEGQVAAGRAALRKALEKRPNDVNFLGWIGGSYEASGLVGTAAGYSRRAFELDPMNLFARTRLLSVMLAERSPEALALARQTVRLFPDAPMAWSWLVSAHRLQGNNVAAVLAATDAMDHVADPESFVFQIAYLFNLLGEFELADRWRAQIPDFQASVQNEFFWLTARGDPQGVLDHVTELMARHGQTPVLLAWHARALIGLEAYAQAEAVLTELLEAGPNLDDPGNLHWAQIEVPILLAAVVQRLGDIERAAALEQTVQNIIDHVAADWPQGALEQVFFLDFARERFEQAVAWRRNHAAQPVELVHMVRSIPFWQDFNSVPAGRAYIEQLELQLADELERLRALEVPWLLEPEVWIHSYQSSIRDAIHTEP